MGDTIVDLRLPRLGETMEEARVTDWLKAPGEAFRRGDVLMEVETDKTVVEVPALQDGSLVAQLVKSGDMVMLDQPFAQVRVAAKDKPSAPTPSPQRHVTSAQAVGDTPDLQVVAGPGRVAASPVARRQAKRKGIELSTVTGSGRRGRITGQDVEAHSQRVTSEIETVQTSQGGLAFRRIAPDLRSDAAKATIVLLHGLFDQSRGWRDLPQRLARAGHQVLVLDLPGHGASTAQASNFLQVTEILVEALLALQPMGSLRLVGHSLGAFLATGMAARLGLRVENLVLISPTGLGARINADFFDLMINAETPAAMGRATEMLGAGPLSDSGLQSELAQLQERRAGVVPLVKALVKGGVQQIDLATDLARVNVPVTCVFGLQDQIVDWHDCANLPARVAIHLLRDAGHLPHASAPELLADLICAPTVNNLRSKLLENV